MILDNLKFMIMEKIRYLLGKSTVIPVFVIGTGRSGTHWLGNSLQNHPEIRATVEVRPMFTYSTKMALNQSLERKLFPKLVNAYRWQLFLSAPKNYLDKSHPNIWIAENLKASFQNSLFIGIEREPYATVASMMKHKRVSKWHEIWRDFQVPNRFLGITSEIVDQYDSMPLESKCALRWLAHHNRMNELRDSLGNSLKVISYEEFAHNPERTILELQEFLMLSHPLPVPEVHLESLDKWKSQLSEKQISNIKEIVER